MKLTLPVNICNSQSNIDKLNITIIKKNNLKIKYTKCNIGKEMNVANE